MTLVIVTGTHRAGGGSSVVAFVVVSALWYTAICLAPSTKKVRADDTLVTATAPITAVAPLCASASVQARKGGLTFASGGASDQHRHQRVGGAGENAIAVILAQGYTAVCFVAFTKLFRANGAMLTATTLIAAVSPMCASTSVRTCKGGSALEINWDSG